MADNQSTEEPQARRVESDSPSRLSTSSNDTVFDANDHSESDGFLSASKGDDMEAMGERRDASQPTTAEMSTEQRVTETFELDEGDIEATGQRVKGSRKGPVVIIKAVAITALIASVLGLIVFGVSQFGALLMGGSIKSFGDFAGGTFIGLFGLVRICFGATIGFFVLRGIYMHVLACLVPEDPSVKAWLAGMANSTQISSSANGSTSNATATAQQ